MKAVRAGHPAAIALPPDKSSWLPAECDIVQTADDPEWCHTHQRTGGDCVTFPTVMVVVDTCPTCDGKREGSHPNTAGRWMNGKIRNTGVGGQAFSIIRCHACRVDDAPTGLVVSGYVTVQALPVVGEQFTTDWPDGLEPPYVRVNDGCAFLHSTHHDYERIESLDTAVPGGVVVTFEPLTVYVETGEFRYGDYKPCVFRNYAQSTRFSRFRYWDGRDLHDLPAIGAPIDVTWTEVVPGFEIGEVQ